jgi:murein DD-endopeptidase MepM/ murein hydrolase activator NlpD
MKIFKFIFPYFIIGALGFFVATQQEQIKEEQKKNIHWSEDRFKILKQIDLLKQKQQKVFEYLKEKGIETHYEKILFYEYGNEANKTAKNRLGFNVFSLIHYDGVSFTGIMEKMLNDMDMRIVSFVLDGKKMGKDGIQNQQYSFNIPSIWPTEGKISSLFGMRKHPISKTNKFHQGVDISNLKSTDIIATANGTIEFSGNKSGYGKSVIVNHGNGFKTLYAHASELIVSKGAAIKKGTLIARMGSTGKSTGPHLHYEIRLNNEVIDPMMFVN